MKYLDLTGLQKLWAKIKTYVDKKVSEVSGGTACGHDLEYIDAVSNLLPTELSATHGFAYCTKCGLAMITPKLEDTNTYLVTESGEYLTDEQGNLLIL